MRGWVGDHHRMVSNSILFDPVLENKSFYVRYLHEGKGEEKREVGEGREACDGGERGDGKRVGGGWMRLKAEVG